jgi:hypothetical protein
MPAPTVPFPLIPDQPDVEFRFTMKTARALERACGNGLDHLLMQGKTVEGLVKLVCYGLQWQDARLTEDKAVELIQTFIDHDGDTVALIRAARKALDESGVYGRPEKQATDGEANPSRAEAAVT